MTDPLLAPSPRLAHAEALAAAFVAMMRGENEPTPAPTMARPTPATPRGERRAYRAREILT